MLNISNFKELNKNKSLVYQKLLAMNKKIFPLIYLKTEKKFFKDREIYS
jgi:hypothetical protein